MRLRKGRKGNAIVHRGGNKATSRQRRHIAKTPMVDDVMSHWPSAEWMEPVAREDVARAVKTEDRLMRFTRKGQNRIGVGPTNLVYDTQSKIRYAKF